MVDLRWMEPIGFSAGGYANWLGRADYNSSIIFEHSVRTSKSKRRRREMKFLIQSWLVLMLLFVNYSYATVTYLHTNPLGSVVAATDESGNEVWAKKYSPFGMEKASGEVDDSGVFGDN